MAAHDRKRHTLQIIFSFFLGLLAVALVGVGVHTFYPSPSQFDSELQNLSDQQKKLETARRVTGILPGSHEALYQQLLDKIAAEKKAAQTARDTWIRNTSIVLIAFATLIMGASLVRARRLRVISSGVLLGGFFTMLYGAAWSFTGGESNTRYAVVAVALVVTLAAGYMKFVRAHKGDEDASAPLEPAPPAPPAV